MWYTEPGAIERAIEQHGSIRAAAKANGVHHSTLVKWLQRDRTDGCVTHAPVNNATGSTRVGARITPTNATIVGPIGVTTPRMLLEQHGLDPDEWDYQPTLNAWETYVDGEHVTLSQLKLVCRKRASAMLMPARVEGWKPTRKKPPKKHQKYARHIMLLPDPHCPLDEPTITDAAIALAEIINPAQIICLGDAADNSPWKRHKANPRIDCSPQEALDATYKWLAQLRHAAPDAKMTIIPGNHDWWLLDRVKETLTGLATLTRPGDPSPVIGMRHLLRLDELDITLKDTVGEYHDATYRVLDDLIAMHGTKTGPHGGATKEFAGWEGASIIQGHDHKASTVAMTKRLPDNTEVQRYAISAGTMARRDLGYNPARNVGQGFVVITAYPDGRWHPDHALYDPQHDDVTWQDWRFTGGS